MKKLVVLGLGAIGSNLLLNLAKVYPSINYTGIDFDKVEERNLRTQVYFFNHVGMPKAMALQTVLNLKNPSINYVPVNRKIESDEDSAIENNDEKPETLIIDCFDNTESRQLLEDIDNCLHIGFSPTYTAEIIWGQNYTAPPNLKPNATDICDLSQAVPFINFVVAMTTFTIQEFIETGKKSEYLIVDRYKIRKLS